MCRKKEEGRLSSTRAKKNLRPDKKKKEKRRLHYKKEGRPLTIGERKSKLLVEQDLPNLSIWEPTREGRACSDS